MEEDSNIDFILVAQIEGIHFDQERPQGVKFSPNNETYLHFSLIPADKDDLIGRYRGLTCKACATYVATKGCRCL